MSNNNLNSSESSVRSENHVFTDSRNIEALEEDEDENIHP